MYIPVYIYIYTYRYMHSTYLRIHMCSQFSVAFATRPSGRRKGGQRRPKESRSFVHLGLAWSSSSVVSTSATATTVDVSVAGLPVHLAALLEHFDAEADFPALHRPFRRRSVLVERKNTHRCVHMKTHLCHLLAKDRSAK